MLAIDQANVVIDLFSGISVLCSGKLNDRMEVIQQRLLLRIETVLKHNPPK